MSVTGPINQIPYQQKIVNGQDEQNIFYQIAIEV